jgi:LPXTG-site transpeptidase (sortase) family protein
VVSLRRAWPWAALAIGAILVVGGMFLAARPGVRRAALLPQPSPIISPSAFTALPGFSPAPDTAALTGMRIKMPELSIDLPIVPGDGWNAPLYRAALYPTLKSPGEGGRSMVYAHARPGMFEALSRARNGQVIEVTRQGRPTLRYRVTEFYPRWSSTDLKWLQPLNHEELVLVTCTTYNPNDPRVVVVAEPA